MTAAEQAGDRPVVMDNLMIKTWTWRNVGGETANVVASLDAGPLRDPATADAEIARAVDRFEQALRRLLTPPGREAMKDRKTLGRGGR